MEFRWIEWNIEKVEKHGVSPEEAEFVAETARKPYPQFRDSKKLLVWGPTESGRMLQVVYALEPDDVAFVIHARPLSEREKRQYRRMRRRRGE